MFKGSDGEAHWFWSWLQLSPTSWSNVSRWDLYVLVSRARGTGEALGSYLVETTFFGEEETRGVMLTFILNVLFWTFTEDFHPRVRKRRKIKFEFKFWRKFWINMYFRIQFPLKIIRELYVMQFVPSQKWAKWGSRDFFGCFFLLALCKKWISKKSPCVSSSSLVIHSVLGVSVANPWPPNLLFWVFGAGNRTWLIFIGLFWNSWNQVSS